MHRLLFTYVIAATWMLQTESQGILHQNANSLILNPDVFYFSDNRPNSEIVPKPNIDLQPPLTNEARQIINGASLVQVPFDANKPQNVVRRAQTSSNLKQSQNGPNVAELAVNRLNNGERFDDLSEDDIPTNKLVRLQGTSGALTNFSLNLMQHMVFDDSQNSVISPYSVAAALSLLQQGAVNEGLDQMSSALQMSPQTSAKSYKSILLNTKSPNTRNILQSANNIFLANGFQLNPAFKSVALNQFESDVTPTNFDLAFEAANIINSWVASKTSNKIKKIVTPDSLSSQTQLVLVNAMYFKGVWDVPFRLQATKPDTFRLGAGGAKKVPFMSSRRFLRAGLDAHTDSKVAILPFEKEEYSLMIILPSTLTSVNDALKSLTIPQLEGYLSYRPVEVQLKIPKFSVKADTDLEPVLKRMGITKIFEPRSDLNNIGSFQTLSPQVTSAVHSALFSIDEEGATAAAATSFGAVALSNTDPSYILKVDRPFIAILWDEKAKIPLFISKIEDPTL